MTETVDIFFSDKFGSRGSGNGEFNYPVGMVYADNKLYVVDRQNHRVQYFDADGVFQGKFGSYGSGSGEFNFPEDITSDGSFLYITDNSNHRIVKYSFAGAQIATFGSEGSGNDEFDYPVGIVTDNTYLYIADKQNGRIKKHLLNGTYICEAGGLSFPEGVALLDDKLAIVDSGNDLVKFYNFNLILLSTVSNLGLNYAVRIKNVNDVLVITDRGAAQLVIINDKGELIEKYGSYGGGDTQLAFPIGIAFNEDVLYISETHDDSHRIKTFSFIVTIGLNYLQDIVNLTRQLYPTGRAWWSKKDSTFDDVHEALARSESILHNDILNIQNSLISDNTSFDEADAIRWEIVFGLIGSGTLEQRKAVILQRMGYPNNILARQHYLFMQQQLQDAGFDVYVHENRFDDGGGGYEVIDPDSIGTLAWQLGLIEFGEWEFGGDIPGLDYTQLIANFVKASKDDGFFDNLVGAEFGDIEFGEWEFGGYDYDNQLRQTFFIGGSGFPSMADVDAAREKEFRDLILKLKPAQTVGFLYINYI